MALTDITFDETVATDQARGNVGIPTDVQCADEDPLMYNLYLSGGSSGGGIAVKLSPGIALHVSDDAGNPIDKVIYVVGD